MKTITNLDELLDILNDAPAEPHSADWFRAVGLPVEHGEIDMSSLPTFPAVTDIRAALESVTSCDSLRASEAGNWYLTVDDDQNLNDLRAALPYASIEWMGTGNTDADGSTSEDICISFAPSDTSGIWSWDETRLLVGDSAPYRIVSRESAERLYTPPETYRPDVLTPEAAEAIRTLTRNRGSGRD